MGEANFYYFTCLNITQYFPRESSDKLSSEALKTDFSVKRNKLKGRIVIERKMPTNPSPSKVERLDVGDIDEDLQKAIQNMDEIQNHLDQITEKASVEILVVEQKYNKLRKPHYQKRNEIIGTIPNFWATVFTNHPQVSSIVTEKDEEALAFLTELEVEEFEDIKSGYKEFHITDETAEVEGTPSFSTEIKWKPGKSLVPKADLKAGAKRSKDDITGAAATFFSWFNETAEDGICEIGESLKDDIWPNPLQYFLNDINDSVEDEEYDDDEEDELEDGIEEEDEGEEDDGA